MKQKTKDLIEKLLAENPDGATPTPPTPPQRPSQALDDEEGDPDNEFVMNAEGQMEALLMEVLQREGFRCSTFEQSGIMTRNNGVVARGQLGKFQITIVEDRRGY